MLRRFFIVLVTLNSVSFFDFDPVGDLHNHLEDMDELNALTPDDEVLQKQVWWQFDDVYMPFQVNYSLFTSKQPDKAFPLRYNVSTEQLQRTDFDRRFFTIFIFHGWIPGHKGIGDSWELKIKDNFIKSNATATKYNIFCVDWTVASSDFVYFNAVVNAQKVADQTLFLINKLIQVYEIKMDALYLIGHSLGVHLCGWVAYRLKKTFGMVKRITGLDPAGPMFQYTKNRLNSSCAQMVDVVHTNIGLKWMEGLGIEEPIGHYDFYVNGGKQQSGCGGFFTMFRGHPENEQFSCDHNRAKNLAWALKHNETCQPVGYACSDYKTFKQGRCGFCGPNNDHCRLMGVWPGIGFDQHPDGNKSMYLDTRSTPDYCMFHWQLGFHLAENTTDVYLEWSKLTILFITPNGNHTFSKYIREVPPGRIHTLLMTTEKFMVGSATKALIKLGNDKTLQINCLEVNYLSHFSIKVRLNYTTILCPEGANKLSYGKEVLLVNCNADQMPSRLARHSNYDQLAAII